MLNILKHRSISRVLIVILAVLLFWLPLCTALLRYALPDPLLPFIYGSAWLLIIVVTASHSTKPLSKRGIVRVLIGLAVLIAASELLLLIGERTFSQFLSGLITSWVVVILCALDVCERHPAETLGKKRAYP